MTSIAFLSPAGPTSPWPSQALPNAQFTRTGYNLRQPATSDSPAIPTDGSDGNIGNERIDGNDTNHDGNYQEIGQNDGDDSNDSRIDLVDANDANRNVTIPEMTQMSTNLQNIERNNADDGYDGDLVNDRGQASDADYGYDGDSVNDRGRLVRAKQPPPSTGTPRTCLAVASPLRVTGIVVNS